MNSGTEFKRWVENLQINGPSYVNSGAQVDYSFSVPEQFKNSSLEASRSLDGGTGLLNSMVGQRVRWDSVGIKTLTIRLVHNGEMYFAQKIVEVTGPGTQISNPGTNSPGTSEFAAWVKKLQISGPSYIHSGAQVDYRFSVPEQFKNSSLEASWSLDGGTGLLNSMIGQRVR